MSNTGSASRGKRSHVHQHILFSQSMNRAVISYVLYSTQNLTWHQAPANNPPAMASAQQAAENRRKRR